MSVETVLWAVKIGARDWQEEVITSTADNATLHAAAAWARANGFDRLRTSGLDLEAKPEFGANLINRTRK